MSSRPHGTEDDIEEIARVEIRPCLEAADDHGFTLEEAEVISWGFCPACQEAATATLIHEHATISHVSSQGASS